MSSKVSKRSLIWSNLFNLLLVTFETDDNYSIRFEMKKHHLHSTSIKQKLTMLSLASVAAGTWSREPRPVIGRGASVVMATAGASSRPLVELDVSVTAGIPVGIPTGSMGAMTIGVGSSGRGRGVVDGVMMLEPLFQLLLLLGKLVLGGYRKL